MKGDSTNVRRLRTAGLFRPKQRVEAKHAAKIDRLTGTEVTKLIRVVKKAGKKHHPSHTSRAWFV